MSTSDPAFESAVISLLKGIYDNIGPSAPYKTIIGRFRQQFDGISDYIAEFEETSNDSEYTVTPYSSAYGQMFLRIDGFDVTVYDVRKVFILTGPSMDPRNTLSLYPYYDGDLYLDLIIESMDSATQLSNGNGLGTNLSNEFISIEIRLYPLV